MLLLLQKKVDFLQSYVNDLTDQIQVLVQTIEDLQREAAQNHRRVLGVRFYKWLHLDTDVLHPGLFPGSEWGSQEVTTHG